MATKCPKCSAPNPDTVKFCGECGTQLPSLPKIAVTETIESSTEELTRGTTLAGRYEIIEELGKGGMGRVYRVEDTKLKQEIALKLIKHEIALDKKTLERFRNELKTARMIAHKNVCRMFDLGEGEGAHFITMEYVRGEDLRSMIRMSGQLGIGTAMNIARQVCDGLAEAHRLGVVHRDLKPSNIMIDKEGHARIMDFGIARSLESKGITGAGMMIGTPEYMSPEQVEGKEADERSDIYALGVIIYEMVTSHVPFEGDTPLSIAHKHKYEAAPDPKKLNAHIPDDLSRVILRCLEKEKERRFQSAAELGAELGRIEQGLPATDRIIPKRKTLTSKEITVQFSLRKVLIPGLFFIFLVIAGLILWRVLPSRKAAPVPAPSGEPSLAILYFKNSTGDKNFDVWRDGLCRMLISDLSQSKYIRVLPDDQIYSLLSRLNALEKDNFTTEDLREIASRGGATHLLRGIITKSGDSFRLQATLQETKNLAEIAGNYSADGIGEGSFFGMIDELTRKIKSGLNISGSQIAGDLDRSIGEITTSSPEAYKLCNEGYRLNYQGQFRKSIEVLEKAVAIDPQFARAYSLLGSVYANLGYNSKAVENQRKAFELSDRLPDRERFHIQSMYYSYSEKTYDKAIEAFDQRLRLDPEDLNAARNLGETYGDLEQWDKALEMYETNIKKKVEAYFPYTNAAEAYRAKGSYDKAQAVLEGYINDIRDLAAIRQDLATNYLCLGKYDLALAELDRAFSLAPGDYQNIVLRGDILYLKGDFPEAEKEYQMPSSSEEKAAQLWGRSRLMALYSSQGEFNKAKEEAEKGIGLSQELDDKRSESGFHWNLGYIQIKTGNPSAAIAELEKAKNNAEQDGSITRHISALHLKGLAFLETRSFPESQRAADEIKKLVESWLNPKLMRNYYHLMGMIELKKENFPQAIADLEKAISLLNFQRLPGADSQAFYFEPLAYAYFKSGNMEKAREQYEKITQLTSGRLYYGDNYAKSFYMLGKIADEQGDKVRARENYQKFLDLWKDADAGLPEISDARERLNKLKS